MKKKILFLVTILIIAIASSSATFESLVLASSVKNQAPNMYVNWPDHGEYDLMMVDFYCEQDAKNTYWAVHNWAGGYAGFQNSEGQHKILLSIWQSDDGTKKPKIEYLSSISDPTDLDFGNEGEGKHIFTNYDWKVGKWYTMCVGVRTENGKTEYAQWVREENGPWLLTGIISYPEANRKFDYDSVFQEDFLFNNSLRKCRLTNAYGRYYGTSDWDSWSNASISNTLFPYVETTWSDCIWNTNINCDWGLGSNDSFVWIQSGGNTNESTKTIPANTTLTQVASQPASYPQWEIPTKETEKLKTEMPQFIRSYFSNLYVAPSGTKVIQSKTQYNWNILSGDGYFYILTSDNKQAVSLSGTGDGADLILQPFSCAYNQKWSKSTAGSSSYYLRPKLAPLKTLDLEGPSKSPNAIIQIWTHDTTTLQFKWAIGNAIVAPQYIKSGYSNLYVSPSGSKVTQSKTKYNWNFVQSNNGYFYILTSDNKQAVTLSGTGDGDNLVLQAFTGNDNQKWSKTSAGGSYYYLRPKSAPSKTLDVEGPSKSSGAVIQIWAHNTTSLQFKWIISK